MTSEKIHITCLECGKKEKLRWDEKMKDKLIKRQLCFDCYFWIKYVDKVDHPYCVRVDGSHYYIGIEHPGHSAFQGFGGKKFIIKFNDGRKIVSTNLWHQGEIPSRFRDRLPDNAKFGQQ